MISSHHPINLHYNPPCNHLPSICQNPIHTNMSAANHHRNNISIASIIVTGNTSTPTINTIVIFLTVIRPPTTQHPILRRITRHHRPHMPS
ncbi:hypothetical protein HanIR_Chr05g0233351 [Helianthus annuus]|nr:hypothetical protein HanIR_Chr05g0233351 [Helianthus annuus]